jgi:hypothetical protein
MTNETFTEEMCQDFVAGILKGDLGVELESGIATIDALRFDATLFKDVTITVLFRAERDIDFDIVRVQVRQKGVIRLFPRDGYDVIIENSHRTRWTKRLDGDSPYRSEFMAVFHDRRPLGMWLVEKMTNDDWKAFQLHLMDLQAKHRRSPSVCMFERDDSAEDIYNEAPYIGYASHSYQAECQEHVMDDGYTIKIVSRPAIGETGQFTREFVAGEASYVDGYLEEWHNAYSGRLNAVAYQTAVGVLLGYHPDECMDFARKNADGAICACTQCIPKTLDPSIYKRFAK